MLIAVSAWAASPRYYIVLRNIEPPSGMTAEDPAVVLARQVFTDELSRHPELSTDPALSQGRDDTALGAELRRRHLKGYSLTLRLRSLTRTLTPPPAGKRFSVLGRSVKLTVVGTSIPGDLLAVGGEGESSVQAEVGVQISERQERELLHDALRDAMSQAVAQTIRKLDVGGTPPKPERRRR